ncbi:fibrinogen-like protein 1 [Glandiceps talaboti]
MASRLTPLLFLYLMVMTNTPVFVTSHSTHGSVGYLHQCIPGGRCQYTLTIPQCQEQDGKCDDSSLEDMSILTKLLHTVTQQSVQIQEQSVQSKEQTIEMQNQTIQIQQQGVQIQQQSAKIHGLSDEMYNQRIQIQEQSFQMQEQSVQIQEQSVQIQELSAHMQNQNVQLQELLRLVTQLTTECEVKGPYKDCGAKWISTGGNITQGIHQIQPTGIRSPFDVYCEVSNSSVWTVIQRRLDGSVDFYKTWEDYKTGFGNIDGEYWLGNDNIYALTNQATYKLRIDLEDWDGTTSYAEYDQFWIEDEANDYTLHVGEYSGTAGDAMNIGPWNERVNNGQPFSTRDRNNDGNSCADSYSSGWWFNACYLCNLNGLYRAEGEILGVSWYNTKSGYNTRKKATMKVMKTY